jgi:hypothetical protein
MSAGGSIEDVKVPSMIRTLVPGQEWSTFWDTTFNRKDRGLPTHHTATIQFQDSRNRTLGPYTFDLDWDAILGRGWIVTYGIHELAGAVRDIRDLMKSRGDSSYVHVLAYSGDEHDKRQRELWEERRKEHERAQQQGQHGDGESGQAADSGAQS